MDDYGHWPECETCPKAFRTWAACNQHMNALDHWAPTFECETCSREFRSWNAAAQHMNALGHWEPEYECETCDKQFHSQRAADQHMAALFHYRTYCPSCARHFMSENNLRMVSRLRFPSSTNRCSISTPTAIAGAPSPAPSARPGIPPLAASPTTWSLAHAPAPPV